MATPKLALPEILSSQAQKEVSHNDALRIIDALLQAGVTDRDLTDPPGSPTNGAVYIPAATATGAWVGQEGKLAQWYASAWYFLTPAEGWSVWVIDEQVRITYRGGAWSMAQVTVAGLDDFSQNPATTTGLTWGYRGGRVRDDNVITDVSAGTVSLTASATNYVELDPSGSVSVNTSDFTKGRIALRLITTDASAITSSADKRAWVAAGGGSGLPAGAIIAFETIADRDGFEPVIGSKTLYALLGGATTSFYKYEPDSTTWTALAALPAAADQGADIAYLDGYLYATRGNTNSQFYRYDPSTDAWTTLNNLPAQNYWYGFLASNGTDLYYHPGANLPKALYRYDIDTDTWTQLADALENQNETDAAAIGEDVYVLHKNRLVRWRPSTQSWSYRADYPAIVTDGVSLSAIQGKLYGTRGAQTQDFHEYDPTSNSWTQKANTPAILRDDTSGGALGGKHYVLRAFATTDLFAYDPGANTWSTITAPAAAGKGAAVEGVEPVKTDSNGYYLYRKL